MRNLLMSLALAAFAGASMALADADMQQYRSPTAVVAVGPNVWVAEHTGKAIQNVDLASSKAGDKIDLPGAPNGLALSADGKTLVITCDGPDGPVILADAATGKLIKSFSGGHTPMSPVISKDGKSVFVCNEFTNDVWAIDLASGKATAKIPVLREPVAAALSPDGTVLIVANLLPDGPATGAIAGKVSLIDAKSMTLIKHIALSVGSTSLRGVCASPDGKYAYVTHILGRYQVPTTQVERGWMNTNAVAIIDLEKQELLDSVLLDEPDRGAANPSSITCTADGKQLIVACSGTHEVMVIDRAAMHDKIEQLSAEAKAPAEAKSGYGIYTRVSNNLAFLSGLRKRIVLPGNNPRSIAIAGDKAVASLYFTDNLAVVDLANAKATAISLGETAPEIPERRGERLFFDAKKCLQSWQSCGTCHPNTRVDALNWDLLNDGIGNPKNTKSMLYSHFTPPAMSLAIRDTAEKAVRAGFRYIQFAVIDEQDASAVDAYLKNLKPVSSPFLVNGQLSDSAKRGEKVFHSAGCAACHSGQYLTDLKQYDVGVGDAQHKGAAFDTPTLHEAWRTAPYLYDGRAATLEDVFTKFNAAGKHGKTSDLSKEQIKDLVEYVSSQ